VPGIQEVAGSNPAGNMIFLLFLYTFLQPNYLAHHILAFSARIDAGF